MSDFAVASAVEEASEKFLSKLKKKYRGIEERKLKDWCAALQTEMLNALFKGSGSRRPFPKLNISRFIRQVHQKFVITACDKNPQAHAVICHVLYAKQLHEKLKSSHYELLGLATEHFTDIVTRDKDFAKQLRCSSMPLIPYLYLVPKIHRLEPHRAPQRPIAGKSKMNTIDSPAQNTPSQDASAHVDTVKPTKVDTTLSDIGKRCADMCDSIIDVLQIIDQRRAIKRVWIVRTVEEPMEKMTHLKTDNSTELRVDDFTNMYTMLPHDKLVAGIHSAIDDAIPELARRFNVPVSHFTQYGRFCSDGKWTITDGAVTDDWSIADLKKAVKYVVGNTHLMNGYKIFRQVIGIAMGENASPPFSTMYLYSKERDFVEKLIMQHGEDFVLREYDGFKFTSRFIDDRISNLPESKLPSAVDYDGLELACAGKGRDVNYLGVRYQVDSSSQSVKFTINDKQKFFPCNLVRFPSMITNVPTHVRVGTVVTMLVRSWRYSSRTEDFFLELRRLFYQFMKNGYVEQLLKVGIAKFVDRNVKSEYRNEMRHQLRKVLALSAGDHATRQANPTPVVVNNRIQLGALSRPRSFAFCDGTSTEEKPPSLLALDDSFIDDDPFLNPAPNASSQSALATTPANTQEIMNAVRHSGDHAKGPSVRSTEMQTSPVETPIEIETISAAHSVAEILTDQRQMFSALMQELREERNTRSQRELVVAPPSNARHDVVPVSAIEEALSQQRWAFETCMRTLASHMSERLSAIDDRMSAEGRQTIVDLAHLLRESNATMQRNLLQIEERSTTLERSLLQIEDRTRQTMTLSFRDFGAGILQVVNRLAERPTIDLSPIGAALASIGPHLSALAAAQDRHFDALAISIRDGVTTGVANGFVAGSTTLAHRLADAMPTIAQMVTRNVQSIERLLLRQNVVVNQQLNAIVVAGQLHVARRQEQTAITKVEELEDVGSAVKHTAGEQRLAKRHRIEDIRNRWKKKRKTLKPSIRWTTACEPEGTLAEWRVGHVAYLR